MFLVFLFMWTIAVFLWIGEYRTETSFWGGCAFFFYGFGGVAVLLNDWAKIYTWLQVFVGISSSIMYFWGPYATFMFALHSTGHMPRRKEDRYAATAAAMLPAVLSYFVFPAIRMFAAPEPAYLRIVHTRIMAGMMAPYYILTTVILLVGFVREKDKDIREQRSVNCLLICPASFALYLTSYLIPATGYVGAWKLNIILILVVSGLFLFFGVRKSAMGIHLYQESVSRSLAQDAIIQSTGVVYHAVKNNLFTARLALQNARFHAEQDGVDCGIFEKDLILAEDACEHTLAVLDSIRGQMQPARMNPKTCSLVRLLTKVGEQAQVTYAAKNITIDTDFQIDLPIFCDTAHIYEALLNLVNNAMEAVAEDGSGRLIMRTCMRHGKPTVQIEDNGPGIPQKIWTNVGTPLFTTKSGKDHFGLGLYYVKRVAELHEARFEIKAGNSGGTVAEIIFPCERVGGEFTDGGEIQSRDS